MVINHLLNGMILHYNTVILPASGEGVPASIMMEGQTKEVPRMGFWAPFVFFGSPTFVLKKHRFGPRTKITSYLVTCLLPSNHWVVCPS